MAAASQDLSLLNGQYIPPTGDDAIDSMTSGYRWDLSPSRTIDWSISDGFFEEYCAYPSSAAENISLAINLFSYYADIKFNYIGHFTDPEIANLSGSDINFSIDGFGFLFTNDMAWAVGFFPDPSDPNRGDIYINLNSQANYLPSYEPGSAGFFCYFTK